MYKYALVKLNNDGKIIETLKESHSLMEIQHGSLDGDSYPSVFVSREDLLSVLERKIEDGEEEDSLKEKKVDEIWEQVKLIPDKDMQRLASKLQDALVENGSFWEFLEEWLDDRDITIPAK